MDIKDKTKRLWKEMEILRPPQSPIHLLIIMVVSIFLTEAAIMAIFYITSPPEIIRFILDPALLVLLLSPILFFFIFRPLVSYLELRQAAEKELLHERDTLHKYLDIAGVAVVVVGKDGRVEIINRRGAEILGYAEQEITGKDWFVNFIPERIRGEVRILFESITSGEREAEGYFENPVLAKSGEERNILWHNIILKDNNHIVGVLSSGEDITERKRTERALKDSERRYRQIHNTAFDGIIVSNADDRIIDCNPSAENIFGYGKGEMIGMELIRIMPEKYRQRHKEGVRWFLDTGISTIQGKVREMDGLKKNGEIFPIELIVNSFTVGGAINFTGTIRDITEKRRAEKEHDILQAQINQSQKMEAIGRFAGGIAHDFNNILTAIRGNAELAIEELDKSDPLYGRIDGIILSVMLASKLTKQLLLFSRGQPFELVPVNINKTIENLLLMITRIIGADITISTELAPNVWTVSADEGNLEQVIMNLALNARDAMPEGGTLFIKTENTVISEEQSTAMPGSRPGDAVCLTVRDTGLGMEKEVAARVFEPFFTTKEPGKGTGFGLAVVYGIIRQHGGWITLDSGPGKGTVFNIYLPAVFEELKKREARPQQIEGLDGNGERILVVEDDAKVREFTVTALSEHGYRVYSATNVKEGIEAFEKEGGAFDMVFSDIALSDQTGFQLADILLARKSGIAILLTSGFIDMGKEWPVMVERGFRYLQKPYSIASLLRAVKHSLTQSKIIGG
ncbi:MAG: PAS domain S-box protein [Deltaproteobacteria bacterium]|nr:PAS domain S-box protein [Deltaproteobacteria bacterium]